VKWLVGGRGGGTQGGEEGGASVEALVAMAQLPRARGSRAGAEVAPKLSPSTLSLS